MKLALTEGINSAVIMLIVGSSLSGIILLSTFDFILETITVGSFVSFMFAMFMILGPARGLASINARLQQGIAAGENIFELIDEKSFRLLGRRDLVINSGGKKIFPERLEEKLADFLDFPFFFTGIPDATLGEKLVFVIAGDSKEMQNALKIATEVLGTDKHHIPKEVVCIEAFVHTKSGKLDRVATLRKVMSEL